jgi:hypothetical protein
MHIHPVTHLSSGSNMPADPDVGVFILYHQQLLTKFYAGGKYPPITISKNVQKCPPCTVSTAVPSLSSIPKI